MKYLSLILALILCTAALSSCQISIGKDENGETDITDISDNTENEDTDITAKETASHEFIETDSDMFTERDLSGKYDSNIIYVTLDNDGASTSSGDAVISGSCVTLKNEGTYIISGTLNNGTICVDADESAKVQMVLKDASISSSTSAPIYIKEAKKVFITLEGDNSLSNAGAFEAIDESTIDGAVFSKQDLTFNGDGTLTVSSPAGHGIVCKDDLVFAGGIYNISCASHAVDANNSVKVINSAFNINAGKDGVHCENNDDTALGFVYISSIDADICAEGDGISAGAYIQVSSGSFNITAGGGSENGTKTSSDNWGIPGGTGGMGSPSGMGSGKRENSGMKNPDMQSITITDDEASTSMKGLKSANDLLIKGGTFTVNSADDALHSDTSITVENGTFEIATGDDALHAEEELTVNGGIFNITECYEGLEALDITVTGGDIKLVATDDGLNAAGGTDSSGTTGGRDGMFGAPGGMSANSNGSITITGGSIYINSSGDGIDSNGYIEMTGGNVTIVGPTQGDTATLDYDTTATITGGTFIGTGASSMAQSFSSAKQGVIAVSVGNQAASTEITVTDSSGNTVLKYAPELSFQVFIYSSPEITSGETYSISIGSTSGEVTAE